MQGAFQSAWNQSFYSGKDLSQAENSHARCQNNQQLYPRWDRAMLREKEERMKKNRLFRTQVSFHELKITELLLLALRKGYWSQVYEQKYLKKKNFKLKNVAYFQATLFFSEVHFWIYLIFQIKQVGLKTGMKTPPNSCDYKTAGVTRAFRAGSATSFIPLLWLLALMKNTNN